MDSLIFSQMSINDLNSISNILTNEFDDFWNYETFKSELNSNNSIYFTAKKDNNILGFIGIKIILDEAELMNIVVKKSLRGNNIGKFLLSNLIKNKLKLNIKKINLEVNSKNTIAIKLYENFGFKKNGKRKHYYGENDAILMSLDF